MKEFNISLRAMQEECVDPISIPYEPFNETSKWYKEIIYYWGFNKEEIRRAIEDNIAFGDKYGFLNIPDKVLVSNKMDTLLLNIVTNDSNTGSFIITMQKNNITYTCLGMWKYFCMINEKILYKIEDIKYEEYLSTIGDDHQEDEKII